MPRPQQGSDLYQEENGRQILNGRETGVTLNRKRGSSARPTHPRHNSNVPDDKLAQFVEAWKIRDSFNRRKDSSKTPHDPSHERMGAGDNLIEYCVQCGRVLSYRASANTHWQPTAAAKSPCDWGG